MEKISDMNKEESLAKLDNDIHKRIKIELVSGKAPVQQKQDKPTDRTENMKAWVKSNPIFNNKENER